MNWTPEQWFTFIGVFTALLLGAANWYDKRVPRKQLSPIENGELSKSLNDAISLANKRALEAEERTAKVEGLYEELKNEFDIWKSNQVYNISFDVNLSEPNIFEASIRRITDNRRHERQNFGGVDRRL